MYKTVTTHNFLIWFFYFFKDYDFLKNDDWFNIEMSNKIDCNFLK